MKTHDRTQQREARRSGRQSRWAGSCWAVPVLLLCLGLSAAPALAQDPAARSRPTPRCTDQTADAPCWIDLRSPAGCDVWNVQHLDDASVTWSGGCTEGLAHGDGSLTWVVGEEKRVFTQTGRLQNGQPHGAWIEHFPNGTVEEGPFVDGQQHGRWVTRYATGYVEEGPYVEGKRHGHWVVRHPDGRGDGMEGPYVDGKRHGHWVENHLSVGFRFEGPYVEGKRHGHWAEHMHGRDREGSYVEGERHGRWVIRHADGSVEEKSCVRGECQ